MAAVLPPGGGGDVIPPGEHIVTCTHCLTRYDAPYETTPCPACDRWPENMDEDD